jgi:hypothetical protein
MEVEVPPGTCKTQVIGFLKEPSLPPRVRKELGRKEVEEGTRASEVQSDTKEQLRKDIKQCDIEKHRPCDDR